MRQQLANLMRRMAGWIGGRKSMPSSLAGGQWTGSQFTDRWKREREPTPDELMGELKNTAYACASINAAVCANNPPRLCVATQEGQAAPKCLTAPLEGRAEKAIRGDPEIPLRIRKAVRLEQVIEHPLAEVLRRPNAYLSAYDLWELTQFYLEVHGRAFWKLDFDPVLGVVAAIWVLPAQNMQAKRYGDDSPNPIDYWEYSTGRSKQEFSLGEIVFFKFPDPREPYTGGLGPLRAAYEQVTLMSSYTAMRQSIYENRALPDAIISPAEVIGEEERDRMEAQWNAKFRRGGAGRVLVAESQMKVDILRQQMGDLAQLAEVRASMEDIANAFGVPIAFLTTNVNMANLQAAERQHAHNAVHPR